MISDRADFVYIVHKQPFINDSPLDVFESIDDLWPWLTPSWHFLHKLLVFYLKRSLFSVSILSQAANFSLCIFQIVKSFVSKDIA